MAGGGDPGRRSDALVDAIGRLQGAAIPASILEHDVLPARVRGYRPADLDALCAGGDLVWIGAGPLGADDGRVGLYVRDHVRLLAPSRPDDPPDGPTHDAIREHLELHGASFWPDLVRAAGTADERRRARRPVGPGLGGRDHERHVGAPARVERAAICDRRARGRSPGRARCRRAGPPAGAGRWSLVASLLEPRAAPTEIAHARAMQLLDRHGVVTREAVLAEGTPGGFAGVYGVLKALEESGKVRRGYFVDGLGAAQFALPGAVDRLRAMRGPLHDERPVVLAATDPAQPYGAVLGWPEGPGRPARQAGAFVILVGGELAAYLERGGRSLFTFGIDADAWVDPLASLAKDGRLRKIELARIDGAPAGESPLADRLRAAGFADGYRGLTVRA